MRDKDAATRKGGAVWVWAGVGIAIAIAAGSYVMVQERTAPTEEEMAALLSEDALEAAPQVADPAAQGQNEVGTPSVAVAPLPSADKEDDAVREDTEDAVAISGNTAAQTDDGQAVTDTVSDAGETSVVPSIDEVRLAPDGVAVIAGRASPRATVEVLVDGEVVTSAQADASGAFAAVGMVEAEETARVLSLRSMDGDVTVRSTDEVILAPVATPPVEAAKAETAPVAGTGEALAKDAPALQLENEQVESVAKISDTPQSLAGSEEIASLDAASQLPEETASADDATQQKDVAPSGEGAVSTEATSVAQAQEPEAPALSEDATSTPKSPQIALLKSDEEGVTLLRTAPEPPARVRLDTIGYTDSGVVQLAGRASSEAVEVRVYLNNRVAATLSVADAGGWRGEVPDVDAGVYTLRVDEIDAQGAVTSRLETPFKREEPEVLAAATAGAGGAAAAVTVQRGDTLWAIARDRYGEGLLYVQVFEANRSAIRNPDLIYPGQIFALPPE